MTLFYSVFSWIVLANFGSLYMFPFRHRMVSVIILLFEFGLQVD